MTTADCLPVTEDFAWIRVEDDTAHGRARRTAATLAAQLGFDEVRVAEVGLAVTELATNLVKHATEGVLVVRSVRAVTQAAVEVVAFDRGPGMTDAVASGRDGESTTGTLGVGMGTVRRLADTTSVLSEPGRGTVVTARFHPGRAPLTEIPDADTAGITRPIGGEDVCGDTYAVHGGPGRLRLMMCDGSGHGPLAAAASRAAADIFCARATDRPEAVVKQIHEGLRRTRGGAVAVADVDVAAGSVRFAGLGNIAGSVVAGGRKQGMISAPGVAGHQARTIRAFDYELPPGATVVLHSDGLTERWSVDGRDRLFAATPLAIAAALLRDAGVRNDDAGVLVGKPRP
ncbi:ATP-binding SpoIIE family protein phosphatase [Amycolatopsis sp., V23-08]|uniref:ATP-binding SpoIIE family protein phosphatase n=1 Tax=Amycolatopsis heterodermiae TaxID=3110235 RepID=A0ABU5RGE4_9PSEU|nr:ATP-binding SpoIIE family protein phosphatase [Amycolatopsis sp., V23-08]MEA5365347.1 ATP-binding SpoIIE family protein phosphatase [Amycolatopsis sp., V23-08]